MSSNPTKSIRLSSAVITCKACGAKLLKNKLMCRTCGRWNIPASPIVRGANNQLDDGTVLLHEVNDAVVKRLRSGPWDGNFGDPPGIPDDSVTLMGGAPGAGKSTLALQLCDAMAASAKTEVLYLCAEESKEQIKGRNKRLSLESKLVRIVPLERMADASLDAIIQNRKFCGVVLDSIAMFTADMEHAVEIVKSFKEYAVLYRMPFIVINHITKDGDMAGSMKLQHAGDISLMLTKGDKDEEDEVYLADDEEKEAKRVIEVRELYTEKSRYGPTGSTVSTYYAMTEQGLIHVEFVDDDE